MVILLRLNYRFPLGFGLALSDADRRWQCRAAGRVDFPFDPGNAFGEARSGKFDPRGAGRFRDATIANLGGWCSKITAVRN